MVISDLSNLTSIEKMREIVISQIEGILQEDVESKPILLVGNKCDLENEITDGKQAVYKLAQELNKSYIFTSAKKSINIEDSFEQLIKEKWLAEHGTTKKAERNRCTIS